MKDLSILIPARNEQFLKRTIDDILSNIEADTEIIAVLDGEWGESIPDHPRVTLVYHAKARGQRAAVNEAARLSKAKYIMKADAHCAFDKGFDRKLIEGYREGDTVIPRMYNLHAFDWVCECGNRVYQSRKVPCLCGKEMQMEVVWEPRLHRKTDFARFDKDLHFQYWYRHDDPNNEVMCFVGACFFMSRDRYFELDGLDEKHGSWGQMGVEVSLKSWLSGGRVVVNKDTWFAHLFRTYGFPYPISYEEQERAREYSKDFWNLKQPTELPKWNKAIYPLQWVVDKFGWY